jgi:hypothetical protein
MTYGNTSTTSLQSLELFFNLCKEKQLKEIRNNALYEYAKWLILHELGHYLYYIKDSKAHLFEAICWKEEQLLCTADDFVSTYAQTDKYEDYAEHFAYWYVVHIQKEKPIEKPTSPTSVHFQAKMKYFDTAYQQ